MARKKSSASTETAGGAVKLSEMVEKMHVQLTFVEDLLGSWPADEDLLTRFIASKAPAPWLGDEESEVAKEAEHSEEVVEGNYTCFPNDEKGLFLWNYVIKGALKEAGNTLKDALGIKNLRSKIDNYVFIRPRRIYLTRNGKIITEPDDVLERPLRAMTMQGPRVTLAGSERLKAPVTITFTIELIKNKEVTMDTIRTLLDYGKFKGIGQWRNGGFGEFEWAEAS